MRSAIPLLFLMASPAFAQQALAPNYAPNFYNRAQQPLSPYLNLLGNNNPAANYYYGVRPGLPSGGQNIFGQTPNYFQQNNQQQYSGFLPQSQIPYDPALGSYEPGGQPIRLNSPGHPILFGNQYPNHGTYFNVYAPNINRTGYQAGQPRPMQSLQGLGNVSRSQPAMAPAGQRRP